MEKHTDKQMEDMMNTINENADRARSRQAQQTADERLAEQNLRAEREQKRIRAKRRATLNVVIKGALAVALSFGLWIATKAGLVSSVLSLPLIAFALAWLTFHAGALVQFCYAKGGFLNVSE